MPPSPPIAPSPPLPPIAPQIAPSFGRAPTSRPGTPVRPASAAPSRTGAPTSPPRTGAPTSPPRTMPPATPVPDGAPLIETLPPDAVLGDDRPTPIPDEAPPVSARSAIRQSKRPTPPVQSTEDAIASLAPMPIPPEPPTVTELEDEYTPTPVMEPPPMAPRSLEAQGLPDLSTIEALTDLPDDARDAFARAAHIETLAKDEEISSFALALVLEGELDVASQLVDAPALRLERNAILRSRGTLEDGVQLRLVCASETARVATWDDAAVADAFRTCPWVEDDLRVVADGVQTKVGVTMGPLGERFDMALREIVTSKLKVRSLAPGEQIATQGKPTPGIVIVGVGDIELFKGDARTGVLRSGDFLFPAEVLGGAPSPAHARAGRKGALVLFGDRMTAQELLMSFPPLLEILAM